MFNNLIKKLEHLEEARNLLEEIYTTNVTLKSPKLDKKLKKKIEDWGHRDFKLKSKNTEPF